jgi:hypothetical protein
VATNILAKKDVILSLSDGAGIFTQIGKCRKIEGILKLKQLCKEKCSNALKALLLNHRNKFQSVIFI